MEKELWEQEKDLLYLSRTKIWMILLKFDYYQDSGVLIDGVTETVKLEIKEQKVGFFGAFLAPLAASLVQPVISSVVKGISGRGVGRAGRGYMYTNFYFRSIL